ncbi:hypothetical protein B0H14DRAFT_3568748 [Mycena olivaceomarginata]|nr:hypothetical protein B0H14DRAFT_3568748 [Mycena olivaceomarginata]
MLWLRLLAPLEGAAMGELWAMACKSSRSSSIGVVEREDIGKKWGIDEVQSRYNCRSAEILVSRRNNSNKLSQDKGKTIERQLGSQRPSSFFFRALAFPFWDRVHRGTFVSTRCKSSILLYDKGKASMHDSLPPPFDFFVPKLSAFLFGYRVGRQRLVARRDKSNKRKLDVETAAGFVYNEDNTKVQCKTCAAVTPEELRTWIGTKGAARHLSSTQHLQGPVASSSSRVMSEAEAEMWADYGENGASFGEEMMSYVRVYRKAIARRGRVLWIVESGSDGPMACRLGFGDEDMLASMVDKDEEDELPG